MPKDRKKFNETRVGKFLEEKGSKILDVVADALPDKGGLGIVKRLIDKDDTLTPEEKVSALELLKLDMEEEREITKRWEADMSSDSWLSKNARPMILLYSWVLITIVVVLSFFGIYIPDAYTGLIEMLATVVNAAYFGSRTIEKYHARKIK